MILMLRFLALCTLVGLPSTLIGGTAALAAPVTEDPLDRQVLEVAKDLRCTVCQNQPVAESNADLARDMRAVIREQLQAGKSRDEILDYFVARYGDYVLLKPPYQGPGLVVWALPALFAAVLAISAFVYLARRKRVSSPPTPALAPEDLARVRAARKEDAP